MTTSGLTLAVTTSTGVISLAVGTVPEVGPPTGTVEVELATERRHAEELAPRLRSLLVAAGRAIGDLDRLVVDIGPGRFTGLRVGLATVRALGFALDLPIVGLTSLEILAAAAATEGTVTAVIDARRQEVFQQTYVDGEPSGEAQVGQPVELLPVARGLVVGDGADRYAEVYHSTDHRPGCHPTGSAMLALSVGRPGRPGPEVQPCYLREPDATPNINTRRRDAVRRDDRNAAPTGAQ